MNLFQGGFLDVAGWLGRAVILVELIRDLAVLLTTFITT